MADPSLVHPQSLFQEQLFPVRQAFDGNSSFRVNTADPCVLSEQPSLGQHSAEPQLLKVGQDHLFYPGRKESWSTPDWPGITENLNLGFHHYFKHMWFIFYRPPPQTRHTFPTTLPSLSLGAPLPASARILLFPALAPLATKAKILLCQNCFVPISI